MREAEKHQNVRLSGGGWTEVIRVGDTVRRPVRPFTDTIHAYLGHLHKQGFEGAPLPLGYDGDGREILTYVPGEVPREPLPEWAAADHQLADLARLVRRLHDAAKGWVPPPHAVFGALPGTPPPGVEPLFAEPELVSHQDYCPGNVVFQDGRPTALIDFDLARPTTRISDVANALYWWAPLLHPQDRGPALRYADVPYRVRLFADAYGMSAEQRSQVVDIAIRRQRNSALTMKAAADADPVFRRWWNEGVKDRLPRAEAWLTENAVALGKALR